MNFYKRYPGDYAKKTSRLTLAQHGAYSLLLDEIYLTEAPLPADLDELYRICRAMTKAEQEAVRVVAERFFPVAGDGLRHNQRATEEIAAAAPAIEAARLNGQKGGRPRKVPEPVASPNPRENPLGFSEQTQVEPNSKAPHSPERDLSTDVDSSLPARSGYSPEFETAWREYPSRTGHSKAEAWRAWKARLGAGVTAAVMLEGTKRYAAYCEACRTEPRFVKHAATFFGPDQHYLSDWTPPAAGRAPAANTGHFGPSIHERRANTMAGLTSLGEPHDDRTFDAEARIVG